MVYTRKVAYTIKFYCTFDGFIDRSLNYFKTPGVLNIQDANINILDTKEINLLIKIE